MAQKRSDETQSRLEAIINGAVFAIITIDDCGTVQDFNPAAEQMFGYRRAEVFGHNLSMLMPEQDAHKHDGYIRSYLETGEKKIIGIGRETLGKKKDGKIFPIHLTVSEVNLADRKLFTGMILDISERVVAEKRVRELQDELIHVARLSAMGEMASALAHELNQPLTAISNYSSAAKRMLDSGQPQATDAATKLVLKASEQAQRAGEIIRRLRQFIVLGETDRAWHDLAPCVQEAAELGMVGSSAKAVRFELEVEPDLPQVLIDRIQIQQVFQNLVRNAVDALDDWHGEKRIHVSLRNIDGQAIEIDVEDTGPGIREDVRDRLFQPFATTKPNGMGIGLSVSRNIVDSHGGQIEAEDRADGGTKFRVVLPVSQS